MDKKREEIARAIWNVRREDEDRCDMDLEDIGKDHSVWREADAALAALSSVDAQPVSEQNARFAIDGAITYGRQGINKPPTDDHWLMGFWEIGRKLHDYESCLCKSPNLLQALEEEQQAAQPEHAAPGVPSGVTERDIEMLIGLAQHLREIKHWAAQSGSIELAVLAKKLLAAPASPSLATEREAVDAQKVRDQALEEAARWHENQAAKWGKSADGHKANYEETTGAKNEKAAEVHLRRWESASTMAAMHGEFADSIRALQSTEKGK